MVCNCRRWISCPIHQWTHVFLDQLFSVSWYSLLVSTLSGLWLPWSQLPSLDVQTMFLYSSFPACLSFPVLHAGSSHSSCAVASLLSWVSLLIHLLSQHRQCWQLKQSSFPRECGADMVDHCWSSSGLSHLLAVLVRRCMTSPIREWSWVVCGVPSWAGASRLSMLEQVQVDSTVQLLHSLLVLFTLEVTGSENLSDSSFCSICT